jgi:hypothetical protein
VSEEKHGALPPPDLLDTTGRLRRLVIALLVGGACGGVGYAIANALVEPERRDRVARVVSRQMSAGAFVLWVALIAGVASFAVALAVQTVLAKRKWKAEQMPRATVR